MVQSNREKDTARAKQTALEARGEKEANKLALVDWMRNTHTWLLNHTHTHTHAKGDKGKREQRRIHHTLE